MLGIFQRAWAWYKKLPWYWQAVAWVVFVLLIVVIAMAILSPSLDKQMLNWFKEADALHNDQVDDNLEELKDEEKSIEKDIKEKKLALSKQVNQANDIDKETLERREAISNATTMEELDALQEKFGL